MIKESKLPVVTKTMTMRRMALISIETMEAKMTTQLTWIWALSQRETNSPREILVDKTALKVRLAEPLARRVDLMAEGTDE